MKRLVQTFSVDTDPSVPTFSAMVTIPYEQYMAIEQAVEQAVRLPGVEEIEVNLLRGIFKEMPEVLVFNKEQREMFSKPDIFTARSHEDGIYSIRLGYFFQRDKDTVVTHFFESTWISPSGAEVEVSSALIDVLRDSETEVRVCDDFFEAIRDNEWEWTGGKIRSVPLLEEAMEVLPKEVLTALERELTAV